MNLLVVNSAEVLPTRGKSDTLCILLFIRVELFEVRVQYVVQANLVSQGHRHVIATWV